MAKSKRQLADEAYERNEARRAKSLQLDIEHPICPDDPPCDECVERTTVVDRAPLVCPNCNKDMHDAFGGAWTPVIRTFTFSYSHKLQCGHCAYLLHVTEEVWNAVRNERYQRVGISDVKPPPKPRGEKRVRGAG
jgi:hypothetical protein